MRHRTNHLEDASDRDLSVEYWPLADLKSNPRNARTHGRRQITALAAVIKEIGFLNPIGVDDDGMILSGHGRLAAARLLGLDTVPVIRLSHLSDAQKRAFALADNRLAERAGWDRQALAL